MLSDILEKERTDGILEWTIGDQKSIQFLIKKTLPFLLKNPKLN